MVVMNFVYFNLNVETVNFNLVSNVMMVIMLMVMVVIPNVGLKETTFVRVLPVEIQSNFVEMESSNFYWPKVATMETPPVEMVAQAHANQKQDSLATINSSLLYVLGVVMVNKTREKLVMMLTLSTVTAALKVV